MMFHCIGDIILLNIFVLLKEDKFSAQKSYLSFIWSIENIKKRYNHSYIIAKLGVLP